MSDSARRPLIGVPSSSPTRPDPPARPTYAVNGFYTYALAAAGAAPVVIPLDLPAESLAAVFERLDGLLLAGGGDVDPAYYGEERHPALGGLEPERDAAELLVTRWALAADRPVFAICRGIQLLNVAAGGALYQDIPSQVPGALKHAYSAAESSRAAATQRIRVAAGSKLAESLGCVELWTNSFHHQAVKHTAPGFQAVAWAEDGVIEGIESPEHRFVVGVQWHPEGMYDADPEARRLFAAFVAAANEGQPVDRRAERR